MADTNIVKLIDLPHDFDTWTVVSLDNLYYIIGLNREIREINGRLKQVNQVRVIEVHVNRSSSRTVGMDGGFGEFAYAYDVGSISGYSFRGWSNKYSIDMELYYGGGEKSYLSRYVLFDEQVDKHKNKKNFSVRGNFVFLLTAVRKDYQLYALEVACSSNMIVVRRGIAKPTLWDKPPKVGIPVVNSLYLTKELEYVSIQRIEEHTTKNITFLLMNGETRRIGEQGLANIISAKKDLVVFETDTKYVVIYGGKKITDRVFNKLLTYCIDIIGDVVILSGAGGQNGGLTKITRLRPELSSVNLVETTIDDYIDSMYMNVIGYDESTAVIYAVVDSMDGVGPISVIKNSKVKTLDKYVVRDSSWSPETKSLIFRTTSDMKTLYILSPSRAKPKENESKISKSSLNIPKVSLPITNEPDIPTKGTGKSTYKDIDLDIDKSTKKSTYKDIDLDTDKNTKKSTYKDIDKSTKKSTYKDIDLDADESNESPLAESKAAASKIIENATTSPHKTQWTKLKPSDSSDGESNNESDGESVEVSDGESNNESDGESDGESVEVSDGESVEVSDGESNNESGGESDGESVEVSDESNDGESVEE